MRHLILFILPLVISAVIFDAEIYDSESDHDIIRALVIFDHYHHLLHLNSHREKEEFDRLLMNAVMKKISALHSLSSTAPNAHKIIMPFVKHIHRGLAHLKAVGLRKLADYIEETLWEMGEDMVLFNERLITHKERDGFLVGSIVNIFVHTKRFSAEQVVTDTFPRAVAALERAGISLRAHY